MIAYLEIGKQLIKNREFFISYEDFSPDKYKIFIKEIIDNDIEEEVKEELLMKSDVEIIDNYICVPFKIAISKLTKFSFLIINDLNSKQLINKYKWDNSILSNEQKINLLKNNDAKKTYIIRTRKNN